MPDLRENRPGLLALMDAADVEARRVEAEAWDRTVRGVAQTYVLALYEDDRPPVFVFFGYRREQERFYRDLCHLLGPLNVPRPRRVDILPPRPAALRGQRGRLIAVHQAFPWQASGWEADDAAEAGQLIEDLNRRHGWHEQKEVDRG